MYHVSSCIYIWSFHLNLEVSFVNSPGAHGQNLRLLNHLPQFVASSPRLALSWFARPHNSEKCDQDFTNFGRLIGLTYQVSFGVWFNELIWTKMTQNEMGKGLKMDHWKISHHQIWGIFRTMSKNMIWHIVL